MQQYYMLSPEAQKLATEPPRLTLQGPVDEKGKLIRTDKDWREKGAMRPNMRAAILALVMAKYGAGQFTEEQFKNIVLKYPYRGSKTDKSVFRAFTKNGYLVKGELK